MVAVDFDFGKLATKFEPDYGIVQDAMFDAGETVANVMRAAVNGQVFPGMTRRVDKPELSNFILAVHSGLEFTVHTPEEIERPVAPYDLKPALLRGPKHRVNKAGQPYNIVPFTHKAHDLPGAVAEMASQLTVSQVIGQALEIRPDDQWEVMRNMYVWGGNLGVQENKRYSNMYRFGQDNFVTFRTVSTKSPASSWIIPGKPANPVSQSVWDFMEKRVTSFLTEAWGKALMAPWQ